MTSRVARASTLLLYRYLPCCDASALAPLADHGAPPGLKTVSSGEQEEVRACPRVTSRVACFHATTVPVLALQ